MAFKIMTWILHDIKTVHISEIMHRKILWNRPILKIKKIIEFTDENSN